MTTSTDASRDGTRAGEVPNAAPLVSVILPTYNRASFLREALDSVIGQTYSTWEAVVVDDGSTDGTCSYLATLEDPRITVIRERHCGSPARLRNIGLAAVRGRYVAFLDSDDVWEPTKLAVQVADLAAHPERRWGYANFVRIDAHGDDVPFPRRRKRFWKPHTGWILPALAGIDVIVVTPTVMVERALLAEVGGFDESLAFAEDYDLWFRLATRSQASAVAIPLARVRYHAASHTRVYVGKHQEWIRVCQRLAERTHDPAVHAACRRNCGEAMLRLAGSQRGNRQYGRAIGTLISALRYRPSVWSWAFAVAKTVAHPLVPSGAIRAYHTHGGRVDLRLGSDGAGYPVTLHTTDLFHRLISQLKPELICDVGSMDASAARRFRRLVPHARIVAFEANPYNARAMRADRRNARRCVEVVESAAWNEDGTIGFWVERVSRSSEFEFRSGISSVHRRLVNTLGSTEIHVQSIRLDTFIQSRATTPQTVALWIDVEGAGFEVLQGIEAIRDRVQVIHVEVETREFWLGQRLKTEVQTQLRQLGFAEIARGYYQPQHDLVFVDHRLLARSWRRIRRAVLLTRVTSFLTGGRHRDRLQRKLWGLQDRYRRPPRDFLPLKPAR